MLNGVFWVLRTGAAWHDLPSRYPSYQTCHRRFQHWQRSGLLTRLLQKLAEDLRDRGKLDLSDSFIDASFSGAKKGALVSALQNAAKAAKSWQSQTAMVFLSPCTWPTLTIPDAWGILRNGKIYNPPEHDIKSGEWKYTVEGHEPEGKWLAIVFSFKAIDEAFLIAVFSVESRRRAQ